MSGIMNNPLDYTGKVALVTGAAAGMGLATARAFAEAGAAVVLADFKEEAVRAAARDLVSAGHRAIAIRCDVSDDAQVASMVDRTIAEFGRLDAAFNNAGVMAAISPTAESTLLPWGQLYHRPRSYHRRRNDPRVMESRLNGDPGRAASLKNA